MQRFDWRWIAAIVVIAILVAGNNIPAPIFLLVLGGSGGYLVYLGWQAWQRSGGGGGNSSRVTYWRGQRIEIKPERRRPTPSLRALAPAIVYMLLGGVMVLGALVGLLGLA
jgi:hypothetical protein